MSYRLVNPILSGFYPDPSICRVDDDFYMVTSSFSYFPGVPVFHSRDLAHWEQIGHVLNRKSQLPLDYRRISGGIYAPTIRYNNGTFYMITTNVDFGGDFICTAENPAGPWSEPHYIADAPGIDPSLFWDDDGKCYMTGNQWNFGKPGIWLCEIDLNSFALVGEKKLLWSGALINCHAPEAPHMYKKDGWYYLMIAEGGTEHFHAVTIARSKDLFGEYEGYRGNPILTHRHLGDSYHICNTGHGDLVQLKDGTWYMVLLASRTYGGYHKNLGRETFIAPVDWSGDWPVVSPGTGKVEWEYPAPALKETIFTPADENDFNAMCWNVLGTPEDGIISHTSRTLSIRLTNKLPFAESVKEGQSKQSGMLGFYGRRQQHMSFCASVNAKLPAISGASCGEMVLQNNFNQLRIEIINTEKGVVARAVKCSTETGKLVETILSEIPSESSATLAIKATGQDYEFMVNGLSIAHADGGFLGSETAHGFVGAYVGMFASGNGKNHNETADFADFNYTGLDNSPIPCA